MSYTQRNQTTAMLLLGAFLVGSIASMSSAQSFSAPTDPVVVEISPEAASELCEMFAGGAMTGEDPMEELTIDEMPLTDVEIEPSPNIWGVNMTDEEVETLLSACEEYDVEVSMALRVIEEESRFTRDIVGNNGRDWGFFQIRDSNHEWLQEATGADPKTPLGNIICGVYMIRYCFDLYGPSARSALTAYRWGSDNGKYGYADRILSDMDKYDMT